MIRRPPISTLFPYSALFRSRPVVIEGRGVSETAVAVQVQRAVSGAGDEDRGERIAIDVGVIGQHARGNDRESRVFGCRVTVVGHDAAGAARRIVDRGDGDGDGGVSGAVNLAYGDYRDLPSCPTRLSSGLVSETAVAVQVQRAVSRAGDEDRGERIAIDIGVVGQHARGGDCESRVFGCGVRGSGHDSTRGTRRIVNRGDADGDGGVGGAVDLAVVGFVR